MVFSGTAVGVSADSRIFWRGGENIQNLTFGFCLVKFIFVDEWKLDLG
jgi:hypothetical protein